MTEIVEVNSETEEVASRQFHFATWLFLALAIGSSVWLRDNWNPGLTAFVAMVMIVLPGAGIMGIFNVRPSRFVGRVALSVALGIVTNCILGLAVSYLLPLVGASSPLAGTTPAVAIFGLSALVVAISQLQGRDPGIYLCNSQSIRDIVKGLPFLALPVISVLGAARINNGQGAGLASVGRVIDLVVLIGVISYAWWRKSENPPMLPVYLSTFAVLIGSTLRGDRAFGWDIQQEFGVMSRTISDQIWNIPTNHDAYASMLSITAFPAMLHSVAGLSALSFCRVLIPAVLALVPVGLISIVSTRARHMEAQQPGVSTWVALITVSLLVFGAVVFPVEMPTIGRQSMALVLLISILSLWFDHSNSEQAAKGFALFLIVGLAFVHYSTSYIFAATTSIAWLSIVVFRYFWNRRTSPDDTESTSPRHLITWVTVVASTSSAAIWNLVITRNDALSAPTAALASNGADFNSVVSQSVIDAGQYAKTINRTFAKEDWLRVFPGSRHVALVNDGAPTIKGFASGLVREWNLSVFLFHEAVLVLAAVSPVFLAWYSWRKRLTINFDVLGIAIAGVTLGVLLRFSGTSGLFFGPARMALVTGILTALPVAFTVNSVALRYRRTTHFASGIAAVTLLVSTFGIHTLVFGGGPAASISPKGENVERFVISSADFGTAQWVSNLKKKPLVQTDRYGLLPLLSAPGEYSTINQIVPGSTHKDSYIFASTTNLGYGRARGYLPNPPAIAIYRFPLDWIGEHFSIVYSTGATRVYH